MATGFGWGTNVLFEYETTPGVFPGGTAWKRLPVLSFDPALRQQLDDVPYFSTPAQRDPSDPLEGLQEVKPRVEVPVDGVAFAHWLKMLMGLPTTTGSGPYTHVFKSGTLAALPSAGIELGNARIGTHLRIAGLKADTLELNWSPRDSTQRATIGLIGGATTRSDTAIDASPTDPEGGFVPFAGRLGTVKRDAAALGKITGASLRFGNALEEYYELNKDGAASVDEGSTALSGSLDVRLSDDTLIDDADAGTYHAIELAWFSSANLSLTFRLPRVRLEKTFPPIRGRGGIQASFNWRASYDATDACALKATLVNAVESYA